MSNVLGCICKDEYGSISKVEGNINSAKCVDILDNNRLPVVLTLENHQWIFQDDSAPGIPVHTDKYCRKITMMSIVLFGHPNHQTLI